MAHEHARRNGRLGGHHPAALFHSRHGPLRAVFGDGIIERESALVIERERGKGDDRLRHAHEAEYRILLHGTPLLDICHAEGLEIAPPPVLVDDGGNAGDVLRRDMPLHLDVEFRDDIRLQSCLGKFRPVRSRREVLRRGQGSPGGHAHAFPL